jgi:hypothetical protein
MWSQLKEYPVLAVTTEELRERAELLEKIGRLEGEAHWTDLDELQERLTSLQEIDKLEDEAEWTDLDELRERAKLLTAIKETE